MIPEASSAKRVKRRTNAGRRQQGLPLGLQVEWLSRLAERPVVRIVYDSGVMRDSVTLCVIL